jgi:hypothetical protein
MRRGEVTSIAAQSAVGVDKLDFGYLIHTATSNEVGVRVTCAKAGSGNGSRLEDQMERVVFTIARRRKQVHVSASQ